jgi:hypothetical protein
MHVIKLTKEQLKKIVLINDQVLVKSAIDTSLYKFKNTNTSIKLDRDFEPSMHSERVVEIVRVPEKISFSKDLGTSSLPWKTKMQLKVGDIAWVKSLSMIGSEYTNLTMLITEDNQKYFLLNYEDFFVAKREGKVICLNGYVLMQPNIEDIQEKFKNIIVPDIYKGQGNTMSWKIKFTGERNSDYKDPSKEDFKNKLSVGDNVVVWRKRRPYLMEDPIHACFNGKEGYFPIQRCDIVYVLDERY